MPNARIEELESQIQDFETLNSVLETICSALDLDETLRRILSAALRLCRADQGSILITDSERNEMANTLVREGTPPEEKLDYYMNRLLAGWCYVNKKPLLSDDLVEVFGPENITEKYRGIRSALCIPLLQNEAIIGVVNLISLHSGSGFGRRELRLMQLLSAQCAQFIENARKHEELLEETLRLKRAVHDQYAYQGIIGHSAKMKRVFSILDRVIPTDVRVLIEGESGTGKERIAKVIHWNGPRKDAPFVAVDCGALPANLLESELFGYVKGAFTGAVKDRRGLFAEADGGTLFLDEITNMPVEVQAKLLRAIQENEIRPLGSSKIIKIDVRIISAASQNLQEQVQAGAFRQDLFYRLNVVSVHLPPLREREEDIPILAAHFLEVMNKKYDKEIEGFKPQTLPALESYRWPGNIREMEHSIEQAVVLTRSKQLSPKDFTFLQQRPGDTDRLYQPRPLQQAINDFKRQYIHRLLEQTGGNQSQAAKILQIQRTYLCRLLKEL